ncbi:uncharacterized protein PgNI_03570, partial [Pyricularia grisea]|uniref:Uncharacterized protein n=1 Tax=Pyricularia grisea TaxID=148305 RepID=A0A6P8BBA0_PYRGI
LGLSWGGVSDLARKLVIPQETPTRRAVKSSFAPTPHPRLQVGNNPASAVPERARLGTCCKSNPVGFFLSLIVILWLNIQG